MDNKYSIREIVRTRLKFLVDDEQKTLFAIAQAAEIKVNAVRRLYNTGDATIQTIEALLKYEAKSAAEICSEFGLINAVETLVLAEESLTALQKFVIFSFFVTQYRIVTGPIGEAIKELEEKYPR